MWLLCFLMILARGRGRLGVVFFGRVSFLDWFLLYIVIFYYFSFRAGAVVIPRPNGNVNATWSMFIFVCASIVH
jgi:hypothetical protein